MICYFVRHGIAVDAEAFDGTDFDRPLTDKGCERMKATAKRLRKLDLGIELIVTSPLVRARQTAEIVADALRLSERTIHEARLGGGFSIAALRGILAERANLDALMLVGHEPSMSAVIGEAIGRANLEMKKGAIACVSFAAPESGGQLLWLAPPRVVGA